MILTKEEARKRKVENGLCEFHIHNPDQTASFTSCEDCIIIRDPCGCDEDMECEFCNPDIKHKFLSEMFNDIILILVDNGLSPVEADRIFESQKNFRLAIEDIMQKQKQETAKEIFAEIDDWTFNLAEDRQKEILISDTGKYKALKKKFRID